MSKKITVIKSKIEGNGVGAAVKFRKGDFVCSIKGPIVHMINRTDNDTFNNPDWVGFKKNYWIDPMPPYKYLNHSCDPNCGISGARRLIAIKDIEMGEEITFDYSTTEIDPDWELPYKCKCGTERCRKVIKSLLKTDKDTIKRYLPNIPSGFKKYI